MKGCAVLLAVGLLAIAGAQPFLPGTGFLPTGNVRTVDQSGPFNFSLLPIQVAEVQGAIAFRQNFTDMDFIDFATNVECLEGQFDTWGTFGRGFLGNLELGGPTPIGAQKANLTAEAEQYMQEVALNEQAHRLWTIHAGGKHACPLINFTAFDSFYAAVYGLDPTPSANSVAKTFGAAFNPWLDDETFVTSVLALEELGAKGNKGLSGIATSPVIANSFAGLAVSAAQQATIERFLLFERRNNIVTPFNETVQQVFARISAFRDAIDGPQFDDQGIVNTDPRTIAVPDGFVNLAVTEVHGVAFAITPKQHLNVLTLGTGAPGFFFPNGVVGAINNTVGYNLTDPGIADFPYTSNVAGQETVEQLGVIPPPLSPTYNPPMVPGELQLTQDLGGPIGNASYLTRGYVTVPTRNVLGQNTTLQNVSQPINDGSVPIRKQLCFEIEA